MSRDTRLTPHKRGAVHILCTHPHKDWPTNQSQYRFGPFGHEKYVHVVVEKKSDHTLEVKVVLEHFGHIFSAPLPAVPSDGLRIKLSWEKERITLFLNGVHISSAVLEPIVRPLTVDRVSSWRRWMGALAFLHRLRPS
jgi:hypothetical protein